MFFDIPGSEKWAVLSPVDKGWSGDKKYRIETTGGETLLLRLADVSQQDRKMREYAAMERLSDLDVLISRPRDFGLCDSGRQVYTLLTWIEGQEAEAALPLMTEAEQYALGCQAGELLKKLHQIPAPADQSDWAERFGAKIDRNIRNYQNCPLKIEQGEQLIVYLNENRHLLKGRPQTFQHGDYHCGNLIVTPNRKIAAIDFNRLDYGDPWEEFNRIVWCAQLSPAFASGRINGYFGGAVPELFFRLLALYIGSNQISSLPWAIPFGQAEIDTMQRQSEQVMTWYDGFRRSIPLWYCENPNGNTK